MKHRYPIISPSLCLIIKNIKHRYPAVVAAAYAASAPVGFYAQQVDPHAYYKIVTASAERAVSPTTYLIFVFVF